MKASTPAAAVTKDFEDGEKLISSKDYAKALKSFKKAAEQGHALAQNYMGLIYAKGLGVTQDFQKAEPWF
ncbi:MAG: hypothetical protein ABL869_09480, partial [Candidatus Nitrotoga sp.]